MRPRPPPPRPLLLAAGLTGLQGAFLVVYAGLEIAHVSLGRATMGVTTSLFFGAYGVLLLLCVVALLRLDSWARGPVVLTQLIQLGIAWNFRGDNTTAIALTLAAVAVLVLLGLLVPVSTAALADDPDPS